MIWTVNKLKEILNEFPDDSLITVVEVDEDGESISDYHIEYLSVLYNSMNSLAVINIKYTNPEED